MSLGSPLLVAGEPAQDFARLELEGLRSEILIRVIFQNIILCVAWIFFGALSAAAILLEQPLFLGLYAVLATSATAMWAHHGARTIQIRAYLMGATEGQERVNRVSDWERALAQMRFRSVLGSRWAVSTKGFFIGSQLLSGAALMSTYFSAPLALSLGLVVVCGVGLGASLWLLREPPLESTSDS